MAKVRRPRQALGVLTRADGVRVEVKNPTIWKLLNEQQSAIEAQRTLLEQLQGAIAKLEGERDHAKAWVSALDAHWWVRLGVRLGLVRLAVATRVPAAPLDLRPGTIVTDSGAASAGTRPAVQAEAIA